MRMRTLVAVSVLVGGTVAGAGLIPVRAQEAPQARQVTIRWSPVKRVSAADHAFTVERVSGRDGQKAVRVETVVMTAQGTQFIRPPREGEAQAPAASFADVVVGARVQITGVLTPDGRVQASRIMVSPPRAGSEGGKREEQPKP